jgi:hypothetical protein
MRMDPPCHGWMARRLERAAREPAMHRLKKLKKAK